MLDSQRDCFDLPDEAIYLNTAGMGPRLHAVSRAAHAEVDASARPWMTPPAALHQTAETVRALLASLSATTAEGWALVPSMSYGAALAARNLPLRAGQQVVLPARSYPSEVYAWQDAAARAEAQLCFVEPREGQGWTEALLQAIDSRTAVVAVPPCHWLDGALIDLAAVSQAARKVGAAVVIDASQALGALPLDPVAWQADFVFSVGHKWLLGPYGFAYLHAAPRWQAQGQPLEGAVAGRDAGPDASRISDYAEPWQAGARRFDAGECLRFAAAAAAIAALQQVQQWGVAAIHARLSALTERLAREAPRYGCRVPAERAGHFIGLHLPDGSGPSLRPRLRAARIYAPIRGDILRIAPHLHTRDADLDRLCELLQDGSRG
ncbi:MAG TPA: aminotransferase class V-fold PLP-dependent enzyme [Solimonas sp.]|nr:aminotransferase class V-fold PLP-dependent enzyme [Solimonas sp.]